MARESWLDTVVDSVLKGLRIVFGRAALHFAALCCAVWAHVSLFVGMAMYGGIICLIPYGSVTNPYWWIPVAAGCVEGCLLLALGLPWPLVPLLAGLLTWLLRCVIARGNIGWDWTAAPILLFGLSVVLQEMLYLDCPLWLLMTVPVLLVPGLVGYRMFNRLFHSNVHRQMLASSLVRLRTVLQSKTLNDNEKRHLSLLLSQSEALGLHKDYPEELVDRIVNITGELEDLSRTLAARPTWTKTLFKSTQWQHLGQTTYIQGGRLTREDVVSNVAELNTALAQVLASLKEPVSPGRAEGDQDWQAQVESLSLSASTLLGKRAGLPDAFSKPIEDIAFLSMDMVTSMREDPKDRRGGIRFLAKYLPRVHHVVDEYTRMQKTMTAETTQRTIEVLKRLAEAFAEQKEGMSRNDAINFTAELDALDTLLKMRSR